MKITDDDAELDRLIEALQQGEIAPEEYAARLTRSAEESARTDVAPVKQSSVGDDSPSSRQIKELANRARAV